MSIAVITAILIEQYGCLAVLLWIGCLGFLRFMILVERYFKASQHKEKRKNDFSHLEDEHSDFVIVDDEPQWNNSTGEA